MSYNRFRTQAEVRAITTVRRTVRCHWCERALEPKNSGTRLAETRDHVIPVSLGGRYTVPACFLCNQLKGNLTPERWKTFMQHYPNWWRNFRTNREVCLALRGLG